MSIEPQETRSGGVLSQVLVGAISLLLVVGFVVVMTEIVGSSPAAETQLTVTLQSGTVEAGQATNTPLPPPTQTPLPTATLTATPLVFATVPPIEYTILPVEPGSGFGVPELYIFNVDGPLRQRPVAPEELRLPAEGLAPLNDQSRFLEVREPDGFTHLGSDYYDAENNPLVPPSEDAILVATAYVEQFQYMAVALDAGGNVQFYLVTVDMPQGIKQYLVLYVHLEEGSNEAAIEQALANHGRVEVAGRVSTLEGNPTVLSDFHVGVIDVEQLYAKTGVTTLQHALQILFTEVLPRTNQKMPDIFVRPEDVIVALDELLQEAGLDG